MQITLYAAILTIVTIIGRQKQKTTRFGADPLVKKFWRFVRVYVTHNHNIYYSYVITSGIMLYQFWYFQIIGNYQKRNAEVSSIRRLSHANFHFIYRDPWTGLLRRRLTGKRTSPLMTMMMKMKRKKSELTDDTTIEICF